jgi:hypothetical protein
MVRSGEQPIPSEGAGELSMSENPFQQRPEKFVLEENRLLSFGRFLRARRVEAGIDLRTVSGETKIGMDILEKIEREDHAKLPAAVYVKGFLRAYAEMIGADPDKVVQRYLISRRKFELGKRSKAEVLTVSRSRIWPKVVVGMTALAGVTFLSILAISTYQRKDLRPVAIHKTVETKSEGKTEGAPSRQPGQNTVQPVPMMVLIIDGIEKTWLKVIIDGQRPKEYELNPEEKLRLNAASNFNLLIGDAGAVRLTLNGKPVPVPGKSGHVVTLQIP